MLLCLPISRTLRLSVTETSTTVNINRKQTNSNEMDSVRDDKLKEEEEELPALSQAPVSFAGRLNLTNYAFAPKIKDETGSPPPQRILRSALATATSSIPSPTKRKATSLAPSPSPRKKSRSPSGYAPPARYAHLSNLQDVIQPDLICLFIGLNPGITTSTSGHAYAHPSNLFWKLLYSSGCTTRLCKPEEDGNLPELFELGNTNIVARPTRNGSELSNTEMDDGVQILEEKIRTYKPEAVCIVGKSIWESIWRVKHGKKIKKEEFRYGWQDKSENMGKDHGETPGEGAKVFVATTTSKSRVRSSSFGGKIYRC